MKQKIIVSFVGARPNFMKMAPVHRALLNYRSFFKHIIIHTGQHYDVKMSEIFFKEFKIPRPHINLEVGSDKHGIQTAKILIESEKLLYKLQPDLVLVYGDVNSTAAVSLACSKVYMKNGKPIPVGHIEAGLRSNDKSMPEEINRIVTDSLSDIFFVTEDSAIHNLLAAGINRKKIFFVGNTMIDSLLWIIKKTEKSRILRDLCLFKAGYTLITLHRPSNVDNITNLKEIIESLSKLSSTYPETVIVFPIHPRTLKMINKFKLHQILYSIPTLIILEPLGYTDMITLMKNSKYVITDSGGIQEETTKLRIPCITLRNTTERPVTIEIGTNTLSNIDKDNIMEIVNLIEEGKYKKGQVPRYWDGKAAQRIVQVLIKYFHLN
ncbi:MAG: non-hydrolyzing UDP-N-acetylglucosamine 2-epimerase [Ignavibacteria bacterium]